MHDKYFRLQALCTLGLIKYTRITPSFQQDLVVTYPLQAEAYEGKQQGSENELIGVQSIVAVQMRS
jgi:hypothetical protein